jgi:hypothetical protein
LLFESAVAGVVRAGGSIQAERCEIDAGPVPTEVLQVGEQDALLRVVDGLALGPASTPQARGKILEIGVRDVQLNPA